MVHKIIRERIFLGCWAWRIPPLAYFIPKSESDYLRGNHLVKACQFHRLKKPSNNTPRVQLQGRNVLTEPRMSLVVTGPARAVRGSICAMIWKVWLNTITPMQERDAASHPND